MTITESIKFDKLQAENEVLKKELAEKDKEIKDLEKEWEKLVYEKYDLQQTQLFKEDFKKECLKFDLFNLDDNGQVNCLEDDCLNEKHKKHWEYWLKDNSKYDKLPSKDDKKWVIL